LQVATKIDAPVKLLAPNPPGRHAAVYFFIFFLSIHDINGIFKWRGVGAPCPQKKKRSSPARHEAVCSNKSEAVAGIIIGENAETTS